MGAACGAPTVEEDLLLDPSRKLIKSELKQSKAEELMQFPGAEVVIMDSQGEEAPVASGTFRLFKLASPSELAVLFVGETFEDLAAEGFYYPLLQSTPIVLAGGAHGHVMTMTAGEGDVFGVRLLAGPPPEGEDVEQLQALKELLSQHCTLQVLEQPDVADKIAGNIMMGGRRLVSGVESVAEYVAQKITAGGELAREKLGKTEEEVKVGHAAKVSVASAKFVTGSVVTIASTVTEGLMETALMLGEEVSKAAAAKGEEAAAETPAKDGSLLRVTKAAGVAGAEVFVALISAGDRIMDETCEQAANTVGHRYGDDAGDFTREGLGVARDVKEVSNMVGKKAVKRLLVKVSMYTARGMIDSCPTRGNSSSSYNKPTNNKGSTEESSSLMQQANLLNMKTASAAQSSKEANLLNVKTASATQASKEA